MSSLIAVAALAGVSKSTASRVITEHPSVSEDAIQAVRSAMEHLNYQPRARRRRNSSQLTPGGNRSLAAFALLLPEVRGGYYPSLIKGFDEGAGDGSHQVLTCATDNDVRKQGDLVLHLIDKRVAGVAILPPTVGPAPTHQIRQLQSNGVPVVLLHRGVPGVRAPLLRMPYAAIGRRAGEALVAAGHRRIMAWFSHRGRPVDQYEAGLREALDDRLGAAGSLALRYGDAVAVNHWSLAEHQRQLEDALSAALRGQADEPPTGIFTPWDDEAELIYLSLQRRGMSLPKDMSVVSFGGAWRGSPIRQQIAAVTVDEEQAGRQAAHLLRQMSSGEEPIESQYDVEMPVGFHLGHTLASPRAET